MKSHSSQTLNPFTSWIPLTPQMSVYHRREDTGTMWRQISWDRRRIYTCQPHRTTGPERSILVDLDKQFTASIRDDDLEAEILKSEELQAEISSLDISETSHIESHELHNRINSMQQVHTCVSFVRDLTSLQIVR